MGRKKTQESDFVGKSKPFLLYSRNNTTRAKYRFASKTLMRILPNELKSEVETLIDSKTMTMDLYEILGQCTWGQAK